MSHERNEDSVGHHRLFHAMVLMGGSLALGCGGASTSTGGDDETGGTGALSGAGTGGTGATGTGGAGAGGTGSGSGGTSSGATGGSILVVGGSSSTPPPNPNPTDCPPTQWTCESLYRGCYRENYAVPEGDCVCDATRPRSAGECPPGTVFACHAAAFDAVGNDLPEVVPLSCSCVADVGNCDAECSEATTSSGMCTDVQTPNGRSVLCNCAVIVLR